MCRNIRTLHNFAPPATPEEVQAAALQYVRKLSGFAKPSKSNDVAFAAAVAEVTQASMQLLQSLTANGTPRSREVEAEKAKARSRLRFGTAS